MQQIYNSLHYCTESPLCRCIALLYFRYDVELFLRIEQLLGHKIPVYEPNKDSVMVMMERVTEAQRIAKLVRCLDLCITFHYGCTFCLYRETTIIIYVCFCFANQLSLTLN